MPEKATQQRVEKDRRERKAPSTQAGEFVREEIEHVREGKHGACTPHPPAGGPRRAGRCPRRLEPAVARGASRAVPAGSRGRLAERALPSGPHGRGATHEAVTERRRASRGRHAKA